MSDSEPEAGRFRTYYYLPLVVLWGLSPAIALALSGLFMEWSGDGSQSTMGWLFLLAAVLGGPFALLIWSFRVLGWTSWGGGKKLLLALLLTVVACAANFLFGMGACAIIDPPFDFR